MNVQGESGSLASKGGMEHMARRYLRRVFCAAIGSGLVLGAFLAASALASGPGTGGGTGKTGEVEVQLSNNGSQLAALAKRAGGTGYSAWSDLQETAAKAIPAPAGQTWCVNPGGTGGCYSKIQSAINAGSPGDSVIVAAGTYTEHITMYEGVSVYGQGWDNTIITGGYSTPQETVYIPLGISASTVLSGVQITGGGDGTASSPNDGGGIFMNFASPTIVNTLVYSNTAKNGGGVFVAYGSPTFNNVSAWSNRAWQYGGGFHFRGPAETTILGNPFDGSNGTILLNSAGWDGGGIYMNGITATLAGLRLYLNTAASGGGVGIESSSNPISLFLNDISGNKATAQGNAGGGLHTVGATKLQILGNLIGFNTATGHGGGANFGGSGGTIQTNFFTGNTSTNGAGGGADIAYSSAGLKLVGNWFEGNSGLEGGGLSLWLSTGEPLVDANTFVTNSASIGGGIYLTQAGPVSITNNIIARNTANSTGGGVFISQSAGKLINNTIADNTSDGVYFARSDGAAIVNNIVFRNSGIGIELDTAQGPTNSYTADYNDVYQNGGQYLGLSAGPHDKAWDPQFVGSGPDLAAYYHIQPTSPVSTTGSVAWAPLRDIDGDVRIFGGKVSMGADQIVAAQHHIYLPLVMKNHQ